MSYESEASHQLANTENLASVEAGHDTAANLLKNTLHRIKQVHEARAKTWQYRNAINTRKEQRSEQVSSTVQAAFATEPTPTESTPTASYVAEQLQTPKRAYELQLFLRLLEDYPFIREIKLSQLPAAVFATPDSKASYLRALKALQANPDSTIESFLSGEVTTEVITPFLEQIFLAYEEFLTQQVFLQIGGNPENYKIYINEWVQSQKGERSITTDSYEIYKRMLDETTMRNSTHRSIAHSILCGPPGTGKTEFLIKYIEETFAKKTLVISCRPYMSFEEMVAGPQVLSSDKSEKLAGLISAFQNQKDAVAATRAIIANTNRAVAEMVRTAGNALSEAELVELRVHWYQSIGLAENTARELSKYQKPDEFKTIQTQGPIVELAHEVQTSFITYLLSEQLADVTSEQKSVEHIKGLLLFADEHNMCVILDEAEKLLEGKDPQNQSFIGLEHILTRPQGSTYELGSVTHTFSPDFNIFMTMNIPALPEHIRSRFGKREITVADAPIDRLKIVLAQTLDAAGNCVLSPDAQKKLAFLVTTAWDSLQQTAQTTKPYKKSWDLRTLSTIISSLVTQAKNEAVPGGTEASLTGMSFAEATKLVAADLPEVWGFLRPLHESNELILDGFDLLETINLALLEELEAEEADFLVQLTQHYPTPEYTLKGWRRVLTPDETTQLKAAIKQEALQLQPQQPQAAAVGHVMNGRVVPITLSEETKNATLITVPESVGRVSEVVATNAAGNTMLVKKESSNSEYAVIAGLQLGQSETSATEATALTIQAERVAMSPDGKTVCVYKAPTISVYDVFQPLTESTKPTTSITMRDSQNRDILHKLDHMEFTPNGRYLVVRDEVSQQYPSGKCRVYDLASTVKFAQPVQILEETTNKLQFSTFKNQFFIYNPETNKGYCIN